MPTRFWFRIATLLALPAVAWAGNLPFGQTTTGTISSAAQSNSYTFSANAGDVIDFTVVVTSGNLVPKISLYTFGGKPISSNYSGSPFGCGGSTLELNTVQLPATGAYIVDISDCSLTNAGNYVIYAQLTNNPTGAANLPFAQTQTSSVSSAAQSSSYTFSANANDVIDFTMVITSGTLVPKIRLYNPNGTQLSSNYSGSPFGCGGSTLELNTVTLPTTGAYTVLIGDCGDTNTGNYLIYTQRTDSPTGPVGLLFGQVQAGSVSSAAQSDSFTFSANAGDVVDFTMVITNGSLVPKIRLYNGAGAQISSNYSGSPFGCGGSTLELNTVTLPTTGAYTVLIGDCGDTNTGNYLIYTQRTNNPTDAANLPFGQTQTGLLGSVAGSNSYTFSANAKDVVDFTIVVTSGSLVPKIRLYNPNGTQLSANYSGSPFGCGGSTLELNTVTLPTTGAYTVLIGDCGDTNTGNYLIYTQRTNNPAGPIDLLFGQVQSGMIGSTAQSDSYTFSGSANDVLNLAVVTTNGSLVPKIRLYNPDGTQLSANYSGSPFGCGGTTVQLNSVTLVQSGTYTMLLGDCSDTNTGNYNLSSQCFGVCPTNLPPMPQTIAFGSLNNVALGVAPFTITATASSGLPVSFVSTTTGVCTVSGSTVTTVSTGTCSITASQAGDASYLAATDVTQSFTVGSPATTPSVTIISLSPNSAVAGTGTTPPFSLTVGGTGFTGTSTVLWNGAPIPTTLVNPSQVTATVSPALLGAAGLSTISVGDSNTLLFYVVAPTITSLSPASTPAGNPQFTLKVNGSGFINGVSTVYFNGTALATTFLNSGQLTAIVPANQSGFNVPISVINLTTPSNQLFFALGAPQYSCAANGGIPPVLRVGGEAELLGDFVLSCSPGASSNGTVSQDVTVQPSSNLNFTSRILNAAIGATEALLLVGDPAPAAQILGTNVFQGLQSGSNIVFPGVLLDTTAATTLRIVNLRASTLLFALGTSQPQAASVVVDMGPIPVTNAFQSLGFAVPISFQETNPSSSSGQTSVQLNFTENFPNTFRIQVSPGGVQNVPGTVYNTESGFVNPALLPGAGLADSGTRLLLQVRGVPSGVNVYAAVSSSDGVSASLVPTDGNGVGAEGSFVSGSSMFGGTYAPVGVSNGTGTAVWEVVSASAPDTLSFQIVLTGMAQPGLGPVSLEGSLAPLSQVTTASATAPLPRFAANSLTGFIDVALVSGFTMATQGSSAPTAAAYPGNATRPIAAQTRSIGSHADLSPSPIPAGSTVSLSFNALNRSPAAVTQVTVQSNVPPLLTVGVCSAPGGSCSSATNLDGSTTVTAVYSGPVQPGDAEELSFTATACDPSTRASCALNSIATVSATVNALNADQQFAKDANPDDNTSNTSFVVTRGTSQTISFAALATQILGNPPFTLNAVANSGLIVALASNSIGVCTVSGTMLTLVAAGACSITATQPGNSSYSPAAPVTVTFTVDPAFADTATGDTAVENQAIDLMATYGITSGCSTTPFDFCPNESVTRGQMAVFIIRSVFGGNNFTYNPVPYFTDVPANAQFFKFIQKMYDLGITKGETATTYGPNDTVTRGEMAVFIIRARYGTGVAFNYTQTPYFTDVPAGAQFFQYIQKMKDVGITSGETATTYGPNDPVTRGQMAVFVMRGGYNLLLPATVPALSAVSPFTGTAGTTVNVSVTGANTNFVQGTTVVTAGAGITVQNVTVNSATSLTAKVVIAGNATLGPESIVATTANEEAVAPNGFTITSDPAAGVVAYFTGNNTPGDAVSGLSGTLVNGATYAPATSRTQGLPDAQAFSLNGTNSYVQAASAETATVGGARTLVAWVYPNLSTGLGMPILTGGATSAAGDIFGIAGTTGTCSAGGQYQLYVDHGGTCYVSDISLAPDTWSLVTVTFDGANAVFYINGVASVPVPAQMFSYGLSTVEIGGNTLGGTSSGASFNGLLSEVQLYGRALTPAEIQGIYAP